MSGSVGVGGAWKTIASGSVGVGGTWKTIAKMWVGVGGAWKEWYSNFLHQANLTIGDNDTGSGATEAGYVVAQYGSLDDTTYTDAGGNPQTVNGVSWNLAGTAVQLLLAGNGIADSDVTFTAISINGTEFTRATATYNGAVGASSRWLWAADLSALTVGTVPFTVR